MRKHVNLDACEIMDTKRFKKNVWNKTTLYSVIDRVLRHKKSTLADFDYCYKPPVAYFKPYYIFNKEDIVGKFVVDVRQHILTFFHNGKEYSFAWKDIKTDIGLLEALIEAYITGYDDFEKILKICE